MITFKIDGKQVGKGCEPFLIAEAGINHNGDMGLAKKMVLAAKESGVDAVKFQTFSAKDFIQDRSVTYTYKSQGKEITEPIIDMFERTEFTPDEWKELIDMIMMPKCEALGYCPEEKSCGRMPKKEN